MFIADCTVSVADFLGDLILIYRCWIIWSRNYWITLFPVITVVGVIGERDTQKSTAVDNLTRFNAPQWPASV